jgi:ubiquinone/menaquinone biosynthesis C-methylase UbiE
VAGEYGRHYRDELIGKPLDRALLAALVEMAPAGPIADIGCGTGQVALHLHRLGRQVVGIDLSPGMIAAARRLCPGPQYRVGTLLELDLEDSSVAGPVAFYSIIHLPPPSSLPPSGNSGEC